MFLRLQGTQLRLQTPILNTQADALQLFSYQFPSGRILPIKKLQGEVSEREERGVPDAGVPETGVFAPEGLLQTGISGGERETRELGVGISSN